MNANIFIKIILASYSDFLKRYGIIFLSDEYNRLKFPLTAYLKLKYYLDKNYENKTYHFEDFDAQIPFLQELNLLYK